MVRGGAGHRAGDGVPGCDIAAAGGDVHQATVARASGHPAGRAVLAAFARAHQHLDRAADECAVVGPADLLLQRDKPLIALLHHVLGHLVGQLAAGVPGRAEYWKVNALAKPAAATTSRVCAKSVSVSPGKPTMMSVVIAASGSAARTRSRMPR